MLKVVTILGTRPEIIRLSRIMPKLDKICEHIIIYTGQNYDKKLKDIFFDEFQLRQPDYTLNMQGSFGEQIAVLFPEIEKLLKQINPDKVLILGDTNSSLSAIVAKRLGIIVVHAEAGNRCFDDNVPEEINRRIIDHCSDILCPYTERAKENLITEGISRQRIFIIGNPIYEVMKWYVKKETEITKRKPYYLITLHRTENVDNLERFAKFLHMFRTFAELHKNEDIIISTHPHTRLNMEKMGIAMDTMPTNLIFSEPFGFSDFVNLEKKAIVVFTDSGTVQEECAILGIPNMTLRSTTERPETIESGSNILINQNFDLMNTEFFNKSTGNIPAGYLDENVSDKIVKIILSYYRNPK